MKKHLLALLTLAGFSAMAQSSIKILVHSTGNQVAANASYQATVAAEDVCTIEFEIQNIGSATNSYKVKRYDIQLNATATETAQAYFCYAGRCFGPTTIVSDDAQTLAPNQKSSDITGLYQMLSADLQEATVAGKSTVKYTFYNVASPSDSAQFSIVYNGTPTGLSSLTKSNASLAVYPNPVKDNATLKLYAPEAGSGKIALFNSLGAVVLEKQVQLTEGNNTIQVNTAALPAGVYFCNFITEAGTVTKRIVVE
jgi:hypothetical protein